MFRRLVLSAVSGVAFASSALAADIYSPPAVSYAPAFVALPSWAGFYIGANGGYGGNSSLKSSEDVSAVPIAPVATTIAGPFSRVIGTDTIAGGFGGGQLGYNFQWGSFVAGFETDIQGSDIKGSGAQSAFNPTTATTAFCGPAGPPTSLVGACAGTNDLRVDYFGTVRGRLGYAWGGTLLYATGGFAYGGVKSSAMYTDNSISNVATPGSTPQHGLVTSSTTQTGWVAGAGIEVKLTPNWSLKGEYQFIDLGKVTEGPRETVFGAAATTYICNGGGTCSNFLRGREDVSFNTVRVGLNYHFNTPVEPLK
jgi:outer membrane immunogenic protein